MFPWKKPGRHWSLRNSNECLNLTFWNRYILSIFSFILWFCMKSIPWNKTLAFHQQDCASGSGYFSWIAKHALKKQHHSYWNKEEQDRLRNLTDVDIEEIDALVSRRTTIIGPLPWEPRWPTRWAIILVWIMMTPVLVSALVIAASWLRPSGKEPLKCGCIHNACKTQRGCLLNS